MKARRFYRLLDLSRPLIAFRAFTLDGKVIPEGAAVDWRALGLTERKVKQMMRHRMMGHVAEAATSRELFRAKLGRESPPASVEAATVVDVVDARLDDVADMDASSDDVTKKTKRRR